MLLVSHHLWRSEIYGTERQGSSGDLRHDIGVSTEGGEYK